MKKWRTGYFLERFGETRLKCVEDDDGYKVSGFIFTTDCVLLNGSMLYVAYF